MHDAQALQIWKKHKLQPVLESLADELPQFEFLRRFSFHTLFEGQLAGGLHSSYVMMPTLARLLRSLPLARGLKELTLDLVAGFDFDENNDIHLRRDLAKVIPLVETVRIRTPFICRKSLKLSPDLAKADLHLKKLVIKLDSLEAEQLGAQDRTRHCLSQLGGPAAVFRDMMMAGLKYLVALDSLRQDKEAEPVHLSRDWRIREAQKWIKGRQWDHGLDLFVISWPPSFEGDAVVLRNLISGDAYISVDRHRLQMSDGLIDWFEDSFIAVERDPQTRG